MRAPLSYLHKRQLLIKVALLLLQPLCQLLLHHAAQPLPAGHRLRAARLAQQDEAVLGLLQLRRASRLRARMDNVVGGADGVRVCVCACVFSTATQ